MSSGNGFNCSKFKGFSDDTFLLSKMARFFFQRRESILEKEKMLVSIFSPFPKMFLTLSYKILTFIDPIIRGLLKTLWEKEKWPAFSSSPTIFSILSQREIIILAAFNLSSANAFNLVQSKISLFGKELSLSQTRNFRLFKTERVCRLQF